MTLTLASSDDTEGQPIDGEPARHACIMGRAADRGGRHGQTDCEDDGGDVPYSIVFTAAESADPLYMSLTVPNVVLTNRADQALRSMSHPPPGSPPARTAAPPASASSWSAPRRAACRSTWHRAPSAGTISKTSVLPAPTGPTRGRSPSPARTTTSPTGSETFAIETAPASADPAYDAIDPADVTVTNLDNDVASRRQPNVRLVTHETGVDPRRHLHRGADQSARGHGSPSVASGDPEQASVDPGVRFAPAAWDTPQTVTVSGADDHIDRPGISYSVIVGPAVSDDPAWDGLDPVDPTATNVNSNTAGIIVKGDGERAIRCRWSRSPRVYSREVNLDGPGRFAVALRSSRLPPCRS